MVAYNFKQQFVPLIESGDKRQTIRALGKRRHARPGEPLQLYTGQRTRQCRKLLTPDPVCEDVLPIAIRCSQNGSTAVSVSLLFTALKPAEIEALAKADGFEDVSAFTRFFEARMPFTGVLVRW